MFIVEKFDSNVISNSVEIFGIFFKSLLFKFN